MKKLFLILILIILISGGVAFLKWFSAGPGTEHPLGPVFCGSSTYSDCNIDNNCKVGGCSGQICGATSEELISTCEYKDCYNYEFYKYECKCVDQKCQWS